MKLTIKLTELLTLLNDRVPHSGIRFTDVEVVRDRAQDIKDSIDYQLPIVDKLQRTVGAWLINGIGPARTTQDKISAIKALRHAVADHPSTFKSNGLIMHLGDAKYAVENWTKFLSYVSKHKELPPRTFSFMSPNPVD